MLIGALSQIAARSCSEETWGPSSCLLVCQAATVNPDLSQHIACQHRRLQQANLVHVKMELVLHAKVPVKAVNTRQEWIAARCDVSLAVRQCQTELWVPSATYA